MTGPAMALGERVALARRQRGMTQRQLAHAIGSSAWSVDQIEQGRVSPDQHLQAVADATGFKVEWFHADPPVSRPDAPRDSSGVRPAVDDRSLTGRTLVLASIVVLVTNRFFTEVIPVFPRAVNFIDIPIFLVLCFAALRVGVNQRVGRAYLRVGPPSLAFLCLAIVAGLVNADRTQPAPALVFVYGFLAPMAVYAAAYRLWPPGHARSLSQTLVVLGLVQIAVVGVFGIPRFVASGGNPDMISGTFGTNAYQLVFFLLVIAALLAGIFTLEPHRPVARLAPVLLLCIFVLILLAQYRALLATTVIVMVVAGVLLGVRFRGVVVAVVGVVAFAAAFSYVSSTFPRLKLDKTASTLSQSPWSYLGQRWKAAEPVVRLYSDLPESALIGTGPGTFSSRAWQTFAKAGSDSSSNVQGAYASRLVGGNYATDVSTKYLLPQLSGGSVVEGSRALSQPYSSYMGLAAEVGLVGLALIVGVYGAALLRSGSLARSAIRRARPADSLPALALATTIAFLTLIQMGFLENWLEVTRLTFVAWMMLAVVSKELDAR